MVEMYEADLDGRCENCGMLIGFTQAHEIEDCVAALKVLVERAQKLADAVRAQSLMKCKLHTCGSADMREVRAAVQQALDGYDFVWKTGG